MVKSRALANASLLTGSVVEDWAKRKREKENRRERAEGRETLHSHQFLLSPCNRGQTLLTGACAQASNVQLSVNIFCEVFTIACAITKSLYPLRFSELSHVLGENSRLPETDNGLSPITEESSGTER